MCYTYYSDIMKKIKEFINKYLIWIILILCLFLFLYIIKLINADTISTFDNFIYNQVKKLINPNTTKFFKIVTESSL